MSVISDYYVHYFASDVEDVSGVSALVYAQLKTRSLAQSLKSQANNKIKQEYANTLNSIFSNRGQTISPETRRQTQKAIEQALFTQFNKEMNIDFESGIISAIERSDSEHFSRHYKNFKQSQYMGLDEVNRLIDTIKNLIKELQDSDFTVLEAKKRLKDLEIALKHFTNKTRIQISQIKGPYRNLFTNLVNQNEKWGIDIRDTESQNYLSTIQNLISTYNGVSKVLSAEQGVLFEDMVVAAGELMAGQVVTTIVEETEEGLAHLHTGRYGQIHPKLEWLIEGTDAKVWAQTWLKKSMQTKTKEINGMKVITRGESQQKIDAIISLKDEDQKKIQVPISAKSYNLTKAVTIVSGTNLWYLLQDEDHRYLYQYLNIMAERKGAQALNYKKTSKGKKGFLQAKGYLSRQKQSKEAKAIQYLKQERKEAILSAQLIALAKAVSGATFMRQGAKLMVINDVATKKIYVIEMQDIIEYILNHAILTSNFTTLVKLEDGTTFDVWYKNIWSSTKEERFGKLLKSVHAQKISLAIAPTVFKNVSKITAV